MRCNPAPNPYFRAMHMSVALPCVTDATCLSLAGTHFCSLATLRPSWRKTSPLYAPVEYIVPRQGSSWCAVLWGFVSADVMCSSWRRWCLCCWTRFDPTMALPSSYVVWVHVWSSGSWHAHTGVPTRFVVVDSPMMMPTRWVSLWTRSMMMRLGRVEKSP